MLKTERTVNYARSYPILPTAMTIRSQSVCHAGGIDPQRSASRTLEESMNSRKTYESSALEIYEQGPPQRRLQPNSSKRKATNYEEVSRPKQRISYLNGGATSFKFPDFRPSDSSATSTIITSTRTSTSPSYVPVNEMYERSSSFSPSGQYRGSPPKPKKKYCSRASSNSGPLMQKAKKLRNDIKRNLNPHVKQRHHHVTSVVTNSSESEDISVRLKKPGTLETVVKNLESMRGGSRKIDCNLQNSHSSENLQKVGRSQKLVENKPRVANKSLSNVRKVGTNVQNEGAKKTMEKKNVNALTPIEITKRQHDILLNYKIPKKKSYEPVKEKIQSPVPDKKRCEPKCKARTANKKKIQPKERQSSLTSHDSDDSEDDWSITSKREVVTRKGKDSKKFKRIRIESDDEGPKADDASPEVSSIAPLIETVPVSAVISSSSESLCASPEDMAPEEPVFTTFDSEIFTQDDDDDAMTDPNEDIIPFKPECADKDDSCENSNSIHSLGVVSVSNSTASTRLETILPQTNINSSVISEFEGPVQVNTGIVSGNCETGELSRLGASESQTDTDDITFISSNVLNGSENMNCTSCDAELTSSSKELLGSLFTAPEQCKQTNNPSDSDDEVVFIKVVTKDEKIQSIVIDDDEGVKNTESSGQFPCIAEVTTLAPLSCNSNISPQNPVTSMCEIICVDDFQDTTPVCSVSQPPPGIQPSLLVPGEPSILNSCTNTSSSTVVSVNQHSSARPKITVSYTGIEDLTKDLLRCTRVPVVPTCTQNLPVKLNEPVYSSPQSSIHVSLTSPVTSTVISNSSVNNSSMLANELLHSRSSLAVASSDTMLGAISNSSRNSQLPSVSTASHPGMVSNLPQTSVQSSPLWPSASVPAGNSHLSSATSHPGMMSNLPQTSVQSSPLWPNANVPAGNSHLSSSTTSHPSMMSYLPQTSARNSHAQPSAKSVVPCGNSHFSCSTTNHPSMMSYLPQTSAQSSHQNQRQEPSAVNETAPLRKLLARSDDPSAFEKFLRFFDSRAEVHAQKNKATRDSPASSSAATSSSGTMLRTSSPENRLFQPVPNQITDGCVVCFRLQASFCSRCRSKCCYNSLCIREHMKTCKPP